jgi:hypothetical protein
LNPSDHENPRKKTKLDPVAGSALRRRGQYSTHLDRRPRTELATAAQNSDDITHSDYILIVYWKELHSRGFFQLVKIGEKLFVQGTNHPALAIRIANPKNWENYDDSFCF